MSIKVSNDEIVECLAIGMTVKEIADKLNMKERTVTDRIAGMKKANGCTSIAQLVLKIVAFKLTRQA